MIAALAVAFGGVDARDQRRDGGHPPRATRVSAVLKRPGWKRTAGSFFQLWLCHLQRGASKFPFHAVDDCGL